MPDAGVELVEEALALSRPPFDSMAGEISSYQSRTNMPAPPEVLQNTVGYLSGLANFFSPGGPMAAELQRRGVMSQAATDRLAEATKECQDACATYSQMIADYATTQADQANRINAAAQAAQQNLMQALANRDQMFQQSMNWPTSP